MYYGRHRKYSAELMDKQSSLANLRDQLISSKKANNL
jgi:hypothetical protein